MRKGTLDFVDNALDRSSGTNERRRQAQEAGGFQFLIEPVDFDFLKPQLRQLPAASL